MKRVWLLQYTCLIGTLALGCGEPPIDCSQYEQALHSLSEPQTLAPNATAIIRRSGDWVIANRTEGRLQSFASDSLSPLSETSVPEPAALFEAGGKSYVLSSATKLHPFDDDLAIQSPLRESTNEWLIATSENSLSLMNYERYALGQVLSQELGATPKLLFENRGEPPFTALSRNQSTTCALAIIDGRTQLIQCKGNEIDLSIEAPEAVERSDIERLTFGMTANALYWISATGTLFSMDLRTQQQSREERISGRVVSIQGNACGVVATHVENNVRRLTFLGSTPIPLLEGLVKHVRLTEHHLAYIKDGSAVFHTF